MHETNGSTDRRTFMQMVNSPTAWSWLLPNLPKDDMPGTTNLSRKTVAEEDRRRRRPSKKKSVEQEELRRRRAGKQQQQQQEVDRKALFYATRTINSTQDSSLSSARNSCLLWLSSPHLSGPHSHPPPVPLLGNSTRGAPTWGAAFCSVRQRGYSFERARAVVQLLLLQRESAAVASGNFSDQTLSLFSLAVVVVLVVVVAVAALPLFCC